MAAWSEQHILQQAEASTERFQQGSPLSLLDGVPFAVKDLLDALPYPTAGGTAFMADRRVAAWVRYCCMGRCSTHAWLVVKHGHSWHQ